MQVADIKLGATDSAGVAVETVYAKRAPDYAVYRTKDRLMIHFADDPAKEKEQRAALAGLGPVRGEINGLIDGWRSSSHYRDRSKAMAFDRRGADALVTALEGQPEVALALLEAVKTDVYDVRVSRARFQYLLVASGTLAVAILLILLLNAPWYKVEFRSDTQPVWLAAGAGAFGAFFSIATGIRNRTVLPDLRLGDNSADAVLRVVIGIIAAAVLIFLLQSGVVGTPTFGDRTVEWPVKGVATAAKYSWTMVVVVAFTAGFLERLVPDLLADSAIATLKPAKPGTAPAPKPAPTPTPKAPDAAAAAAVEASEDEDTCVDHQDPADNTPDDELPQARGGVATL